MAKGIEGSGEHVNLGAGTPEPTENVPAENRGISRRKFLKILGATSVAGAAAGCADKATQNIFPNVKGETDQIPGDAVWYRSTCTECSAGCGIQVRTREGRAVKIEGSPDHPVNRGGLCALGQSAIQHHYDPDRIRQPLSRKLEAGMGGAEKVTFVPVSWEEALVRIADALKQSASKKKILLTGEQSGALEELLGEWTTAAGIDRVVYDPLQPTSAAHAADLVYGTYGIPAYSIDKAEVVLNFGSDFLETWVSPCEYARDWASTRRSEKPVRVVHIEPRLSLTGANADLWLSAAPGTEVRLALYLLKSLLASGKGQNLRDEIRERASKLVEDISLGSVSAETGIPKEKITLVAEYLRSAKTSLVLAGGAAGSSLPLMVVANLLNIVLGNLGKTVNVAASRKPKASIDKLAAAIEAMSKDEVGALFIYGANPSYSLSSAYGFDFAAKRVPLVVSFASHMDETTGLADLILPVNSSLESWGDVRSVPGQYGLLQPTMSPLWDTQPIGDLVLQIAKSSSRSSVGGGAKTFEAYLKSSWTKLHKTLGVTESFDKFWLASVERGGYFEAAPGPERTRVSVDSDIFSLSYDVPHFERNDVAADKSLVLLPFPSVLSFDGRAANRPWLHETPDPISQVVWDGWAEVHPETAKKFGIAQGDFVTVRNAYGEVDVPAYLTEHVHREVIAVPLGHGHTNFGRYAQEVRGANVFTLLPRAAQNQSQNIPLLSTYVAVTRGRGAAALINLMGSDSQLGRGLARTKVIEDGGAEGHDDHHGEGAGHGGHGGHGPVKQMYEQREHPLYRWGMAVDLAACTGCMGCVVACYAENNIPVVGKEACSKGREMSWLRMERYYDGTAEELQVSFLPMMCQHCGNAPCEPVCPVYATYHNEEGLNAMVYNRCVGTRYCSNNCSYKVRRFNWHEFDLPQPMEWQLNPDVVKRSMGVMEKCTFCVQRINEAKDKAKDLGRQVEDGEIKPACVQSCSTDALVFGNLNDPNSRVSKLSRDKRAYKVLDSHLNTQPAISYLERTRYGV